MYRKDLKELTGISVASAAKPNKVRNITTDVLLKICKALDYNIEDIIEIIEEN